MNEPNVAYGSPFFFSSIFPTFRLFLGQLVFYLSTPFEAIVSLQWRALAKFLDLNLKDRPLSPGQMNFKARRETVSPEGLLVTPWQSGQFLALPT